MSESVTFSEIYHYNTLKVGITVPARLTQGSETVVCEAKLDTGSSHCIFRRSYAELLGLDVEKVAPVSILTVTGSFTAYPFEIGLVVLGIRTESMVYFASDDAFPRNVLGRAGWLDRIKLGLIDYEGKLLLSACD